MKRKKYLKESMGMVTTGVGLGLGSSMLGEAGSTYGQQAVGKVAKGMKPIGSMFGAGMVMDSLEDLNKKAKKMKK